MTLTSKEASKKWTPGPWKVGNTDEVYAGSRIVAGTYSDTDYMPHPNHRIDGKRVTLPNKKEGIANARLIAAAPALYDALYALAMDEGDGIDLMTNARAALSLARTQERGVENG